jgi:broad specificity phosphatase PhoE
MSSSHRSVFTRAVSAVKVKRPEKCFVALIRHGERADLEPYS